MSREDDTLELARLDAVIADNDAAGTPNAVWRAADAVYSKARLVEVNDPEGAMALYENVAERLADRHDDGPRELVIFALGDCVRMLMELGRSAEARRAAQSLVDQHFGEAPVDAASAVVAAVLRLGRFMYDAGELTEALELFDRTAEIYGRPHMVDRTFTLAATNAEAGWILRALGDYEGALRRLAIAIEVLADPAETRDQKLVAQVLVRQAQLHDERGDEQDRNAACRDVIRRFGGHEDQDIAGYVEWARQVVERPPGWPKHRRFQAPS